MGLATETSQVVSGRELADASPQHLKSLVQHVRVFARVAPGQKLQLVEAAREAGHYVAVVGYGVFLWALGDARDDADTQARARNALLLFLVLAKTFHLGAARSETRYALSLSPWKSPVLVGCGLAAVLIHIAALYLPWTQAVLKTQPVGWELLTGLLLLGLIVFAAMEIHKWSWQWRYGAGDTLKPPHSGGS